MLASEVYADDGTLMGKYYKDKSNRSNVEYHDISKNAINALLSTEDKRFYDHSGIDGMGVLRAVVKLGQAWWWFYHYPAAGQIYAWDRVLTIWPGAVLKN